MSNTKKVLFTVFTVLLVGALTFLIIWGVTNFNKVQEGLSGTGLYTKEDVDNAYRDGYNMALFDKGAFETQITELRNELTEKQAEVDALKNVESENADLKNIIAQLEEEIDNLNKTITVYEKFVKEVEESNKVIATFMIDGVAYEMHSYTPGQAVTFPVPADDYCRVNSWVVNSEAVDVANYVINENTTFVADVTFPYVVTFVSNDNEYDKIVCYPGESFDLPAEPTVKSGYIFVGWTLDGNTVVDVVTLPEANATYYALFYETVKIKLTYDTMIPSVVGNNTYLFKVNSLSAKYSSSYLYNYVITEENSLYYNGVEFGGSEGSIRTENSDGSVTWEYYLCLDSDDLISAGVCTYSEIQEIVSNDSSITLEFTFKK